MTGQRHEFRALTVLTAIALVIADGWAAWQWNAGQEALAASQERLSACEGLAQHIAKLRTAPVKVDDNARTSDTLAKLVESAAQASGLAAERIVHVAPGEPRRMADSSYLEQTTAVELRDVSLQQLIEFTLTVSKLAPGLQATQLAIRVPPSADNSSKGRELWNVQLVLTSHIYAPRIPSSPQVPSTR